MRKKGFTLIELLAVIVILAIIALIATPIILGIINDARKESNERSIELYANAIRNGIASHQLRTGNKVESGIYTKENPLPFEVEVEGNVECSTIEIKDSGEVSVSKCTVNGNKIDDKEEIVSNGKACTLDDKDKDGVASLSDIVTCGTESFYVMSNENNEITMLSMYNLYIGDVVTVDEEYNWLTQTPIENPTGKQDPLAKGYVSGDATYYGTVAFATSPYWPSDRSAYVYNESSNLYQYVSAYEKYLKENGVRSASATLISYEQTNDLITKFGNPNWLYNTSYWTGSAVIADSVYVVYSDGDFSDTSSNDDYYYGVRPVITISTTDL